MTDRRPENASAETSTKVNTTVMFADIARSTNLYTRLGDQEAARLVVQVLDVLASTVRSNGGRPFRSKGDDLLSTFESPDDAVRAAVQIHKSVRALSTPKSGSLEMRIGINTGPAVLIPGDILGDTVNLTARITDFAKAGQTLVSGQLMDSLSDPDLGHFRPLGNVSPRGKTDHIALFELHDAGELDEITQTGPVVKTGIFRQHQLNILFQGKKIRLESSLDRFRMGRAPDCELTIDHTLVSRYHAEIRFENNHFVLVDFSTNGTLLITGGASHLLHHGQEVLRGRGTIFLGRTGFDRNFEITFHTDDDP